MKRELGIARCGLACCLCSENVTCKGCKRDGFMELSWCKDAEWCEVRRCGIDKNLNGCYECTPAECRKGLYAEKIKPRAFAEFARRYGIDELLDCLERNEQAGIVYHREGIMGDYDDFDDIEELIDFIKTGKRAAEANGSHFELLHASCADQQVDVVVNAANSGLWAGGGICGVIFSKAGSELAEACRKYKTPLNDGDAVITPAFKMKNAKAIIHAVGPNFGVMPTAFDELFKAYFNSLVVLKENGYHSISFPLISSGIFGGNLENPAGESTKQCLRAYKKFVTDDPEYAIDVKLCAFTAAEMRAAERELDQFRRENKGAL